jgi:AcrR family transcriptional regulator
VSVQKKKTESRLAHGEAYQRIIDAAEILFSERSPEQVGFRELATAAGVSLSAIHYHFGSKEALLKEIFAIRAAPLTQKRAENLARLEREDRADDLGAILDAFVRPAFDVTRGNREDLFNKLRARLAVEASTMTRETISDAFDASDAVFLESIHRAVPGLTKADVYWRFHFFVGAMIYTMSDSGQLEGLSMGACSPSSVEESIAQLVRSFTAVFKAPSVLQA